MVGRIEVLLLKISTVILHIFEYFALSALFILITSIFIAGFSSHFPIKIGHLLITSITLGLFLFYNKNKQIIFSLVGLWIFIVLPIFLIKFYGEPDGRAAKEISVAITESNLFAINISITLITLLFLTIRLTNTLIRTIAQFFTCVIWSISLLLPLSFYCYWLFADSLITSNVIIALFQTTPAEAVEYVSYRGTKFITGIVVLLLSLLAINIVLLKNKKYTKNDSIIISAIITIIGVICTYKTSSNYITYPIIDAAIGIKEYNSFKEGFSQRKENIQQQLQSIKQQGDNGLFVVVIGESQTKTHMSAYGYKRNTTPWLTDKLNSENFIIFDNTFSCYVNTVSALSQALTAANQYSSLQLAQAPSILEIAKAAGFETWWLSNQNKFGAWDTPTTIIANQADHTTWINSTIGEIVRSPFFDAELIKFIDKIPDSPGKKLVILHTLGCHTHYNFRYPESFQKWKNENKVDYYDNAVLYQDFFMKELYKTLNSRKDFRALIMLSDHGEEPNIGHDPDRFRWDMTQIPFWVAFSKNYAEKRSDTVAALEANRSKAFTNDMFFDFLCGFLNIKDNPYYEAKNDISSASYNRSEDNMTILGKSKSIKDAKN
ncbi:MAG: phosphoethanolamine transferase [Sutterella sp.]|nr:phosphoethanolamine transferase [Sutterella sp.]